MTGTEQIDDDDDDLLTKQDCLTEIVFGDDNNSDRHWDALMRFVELGGTQDELRAAFDDSIGFMKHALEQGRH